MASSPVCQLDWRPWTEDRQRTDTRDQLIAAARELFARDGFEATSTEAVLQRSGVSRGSLYHQFPDKKALFEAVLIRVHAEAVQITIRAARGPADGVAALRAGCLAWIKLARDPRISRIVLIDAPSVVGWARWRQIDEEHSFGVVKAETARRPNAALCREG